MCVPVVIGVGEPAQRLAFLTRLFGIEMVDSDVVLIHIFIIDYHVGSAQIVCEVGADTHGVVVVNLPVGACGIDELVVFPSHGVRTRLQKQLGGVCGLFEVAVLAVIHVIEPHAAKHVESILAIVEVEFCAGRVETVAQILVIGERKVNTQSVARQFLRANPHYRPHGGIVLCAGIVDYLHIADVFTAQTFQFVHVAKHAAVQIDERCPFAQHFGIVFATRHSGHLDEHF